MAHRILQSDVQGITDDGVPNGHLIERLDMPGEPSEVVEVQIVASIDAKAGRLRHLGGCHEGGGGRFGVHRELLGVRPRVQFHPVCPDIGSRTDEVSIRTDEQTRPNARRPEPAQDFSKERGMGSGVPSGIGRENVGRIRHEGDLFRLDLEHERYEISRGITLDIELGGDPSAQPPDVRIGDVPCIGTGVHRNAVGAPALNARGCFEGTRPVTTAGIAQGGDLVDVDAETRGESFHGPTTVARRQTANFAKSRMSETTKSMHAASIINEELIALNPGDTLEKALRAMDELKVEHLPVVAEGRYLGLVAEQHLLDQEGEAVFLTNVQLMPLMVAPGQHFLEVVDVLCEADVSVVPVVDHGMLLGCTDRAHLWRAFHNSLTPYSEGSILTLEMPWKDYSLAQVSHRVESEGVKILQVLVSDGTQPENAEVALRLSTRDIEGLIDSLRRHGYEVRAFYRAEEYEEELKRRMEAFRRYMNI